MTQEERKNNFINKAKKIHNRGNIIYDYVVYVNNRTPVKLYDKDLKEDGTEYGIFYQTPSNHLKGQEHPLKKNKKISSKKSFSQSEIIKRFKEIHGEELYDYKDVYYVNMHTPVKIFCNAKRNDGSKYGVFFQEPCVHLKGCGHPELAKDKQILKQTYTTEQFIELSKKANSNRDYDYSKVVYNGSKNKVCVICNKNKHGEFNIYADALLQGKGCPKCGNVISNAEDEIARFINDTLNIRVEQRNKNILNGKEIDIFIPSHNIGFEYNGLRWHSEEFIKDKNYHLNKQQEAQKCGIKLFHIFEDEYLYHKEVLLSKIKRILKASDDLFSIGARKCIIKEINAVTAKNFLDKNHIQGGVDATLHLGSFYNDKLVSVMSFTKECNCWNLVRFASDINYNIQGMCSKFVKYFFDTYNCDTLKTFLDKRWCIDEDDNVYIKSGFVKSCILKPNYYYTDGHGKRLHRFNFRKEKLLKRYNFLNKNMTEIEMAKELGYYRIFDCGLIKYKKYGKNTKGFGF